MLDRIEQAFGNADRPGNPTSDGTSMPQVHALSVLDHTANFFQRAGDMIPFSHEIRSAGYAVEDLIRGGELDGSWTRAQAQDRAASEFANQNIAPVGQVAADTFGGLVSVLTPGLYAKGIGLAMPTAQTALGRVGQTMGLGALEGLISGYAEGDSLEERARNSLILGTFGAGLNGVVDVVGNVLGSGARAISRRLGTAEERAMQSLFDGIPSNELMPEEVAAVVAQLQDARVPGAIVDSGPYPLALAGGLREIEDRLAVGDFTGDALEDIAAALVGQGLTSSVLDAFSGEDQGGMQNANRASRRAETGPRLHDTHATRFDQGSPDPRRRPLGPNTASDFNQQELAHTASSTPATLTETDLQRIDEIFGELGGIEDRIATGDFTGGVLEDAAAALTGQGFTSLGPNGFSREDQGGMQFVRPAQRRAETVPRLSDTYGPRSDQGSLGLQRHLPELNTAPDFNQQELAHIALQTSAAPESLLQSGIPVLPPNLAPQAKRLSFHRPDRTIKFSPQKLAVIVPPNPTAGPDMLPTVSAAARSRTSDQVRNAAQWPDGSTVVPPTARIGGGYPVPVRPHNSPDQFQYETRTRQVLNPAYRAPSSPNNATPLTSYFSNMSGADHRGPAAAAPREPEFIPEHYQVQVPVPSPVGPVIATPQPPVASASPLMMSAASRAAAAPKLRSRISPVPGAMMKSARNNPVMQQLGSMAQGRPNMGGAGRMAAMGTMGAGGGGRFGGHVANSVSNLMGMRAGQPVFNTPSAMFQKQANALRANINGHQAARSGQSGGAGKTRNPSPVSNHAAKQNSSGSILGGFFSGGKGKTGGVGGYYGNGAGGGFTWG